MKPKDKSPVKYEPYTYDMSSDIKELFDWVHSLNDMDRILLNRIEYLESKLKGEADEE
tara:strand:+ start:661 stop:834 length:174 start_codon:yes stop_codon:yes gene_type:complete